MESSSPGTMITVRIVLYVHFRFSSSPERLMTHNSCHRESHSEYLFEDDIPNTSPMLGCSSPTEQFIESSTQGKLSAKARTSCLEDFKFSKFALIEPLMVY